MKLYVYIIIKNKKKDTSQKKRYTKNNILYIKKQTDGGDSQSPADC